MLPGFLCVLRQMGVQQHQWVLEVSNTEVLAVPEDEDGEEAEAEDGVVGGVDCWDHLLR